ncbi:MAG: hypothetical protein QXJ53_01165 [Candidatus Bathyarchaeia archaeon]
MPINLDALAINIIINIIVISPVLWLAGIALVGRRKAKFTDAIWITVLGTIVATFFGAFFVGIIASIIQLILWLALVKHFFDCGWLMALAISILAVAIFVVIVTLLKLIGIVVWSIWF